MKLRIVGLISFMALASCAKEPFQRGPMVALQNPDPMAIRQSFGRSMPLRFTTDDTMIVQAPFHNDIAILDVLRVDREAGSFELVGLNQTGVKLFDLRGDRRGVAIVFAITPLMNHQDLLLAVAKDFQHIFLDLIPGNGAKTEIDPNSVRFTQKTDDGTLTYEFGGDPAILMEKRLSGFFGSIWDVGYYQYEPTTTGLYPRGIVMDNSRYHYRIIVKNHDVEIDP